MVGGCALHAASPAGLPQDMSVMSVWLHAIRSPLPQDPGTTSSHLQSAPPNVFDQVTQRGTYAMMVQQR
ncbi:hypothetical protein ABBQ38_013375 [Trebouxia sp. C0009 RCD-2024]